MGGNHSCCCFASVLAQQPGQPRRFNAFVSTGTFLSPTRIECHTFDLCGFLYCTGFKARKFRAGSEVLLLEAVKNIMESSLSETRHLSCKRQYSERKEGCVLPDKEASRQYPLLAGREGHIEHSAPCRPQAGSEVEI